MKTNLHNVFSNKITGEWGDDDPMGKGVNIIRTANFRNDGSIDFSNLVTRLIQKDAKDENGKVIKLTDGKNEKESDFEKIDEKKLLDEDIIIEKSGGGIGTPVGRVVFFENPNSKVYLSNNFSQTLRVDSNIAVPKYIFYYLKYLYKRGNVLKYQNQTTGLFNLKLEKYFQEEIILPNHSIQYAIVTQLDSIQELIDKRIKSIETLDKLAESTYFEMFGTPFSNPQKWELKKLDDLKEDTKNAIKAGPFGSSLKKEYYVDKGYKIYGQEQVIKNDFNYGEYYIDEERYKLLKSCSIKTDDVLISLVGTFGKVAIVPEKITPGIINPRLIKISFNQDIILPIFFKHLFETDFIKAYLQNISKGGTVSSLNLKLLKEIPFPIPPIELQHEFVSIKNRIDYLIYNLKKSLEILQTLFQAVLQNVFNPNTEIDEQPIFNELVKKLEVDDLKGNKKRLQYLLELFKENKFDNTEDYIETKDKLFELILAREIEQIVNNENEIILQVK